MQYRDVIDGESYFRIRQFSSEIKDILQIVRYIFYTGSSLLTYTSLDL